ncbi:MAG: M18 family aminopeptidase [Clostridia bacterium]|nr:M18 family aminopeptidase [Clostridia bacterium]
MKTTQNLLAFIQKSPSTFHAVANMAAALEKSGGVRLDESRAWTLTPGKNHFVTRNGSSIIAFRLPEMWQGGFMITAAHSDSPTFKIKDIPELESSLYTRLNTERYGGMILDSWFDRPLSVAGRLIVRTERGVASKLVDVGRDLCMIPHVAIHMMNPNEGLKYNPATDLMPLLGDGSAKGSFLQTVADAAEVDVNDILGHDLFLYNRQEPSIWGAAEEYISSPKLDDLQCAWSSLEAFLAAGENSACDVMFVADNEEVGSVSRQGAGSDFLSDTLRRICNALGEDCRQKAASSLLLSADNAHAVHPNHGELHDPTHRPRMNGGVVMKFNAAQRYTTHGVSAALFREICRRADVPVQVFANRSDLRGGSTLGNISNSQVSLMAVDIGLAQLAMHSSYETAGALDTGYMVSAMKQFFQTSLDAVDGEITIR